MQRLAHLVVAAAAFCTAGSANATTWLKDTVSGIFNSGTDIYGDFGAVGADLTGTSYSFSIYYRDTDVEQIPGNLDFLASAKWASGLVGDFKIPLNASGGRFRSYEDYSIEVSARGNASLGYPAFRSYFDGPFPADPYNEAVMFSRGSRVAMDFEPIRSVETLGPGPIPEPSTWAMLLLGFGAIGGAIRSRKTSTAVAYV
jgi:hypothetical protein